MQKAARPLHKTLLLLVLEAVFDSLLRVDDLAKTEPWLIDGTLSRVDEQVIENAAKEAAWERRHHGNPEVIPSCGPDFGTVADAVGPETGAKVTSKVDSEAGLPAEGSADAELRECVSQETR